MSCRTSPTRRPAHGHDLPLPSATEQRALIDQADHLYAGPRTVDRVLKSLAAARRAGSVKRTEVSRAGKPTLPPLDAAWRAQRASYWLARFHPDEKARLEHAREGVTIGEEALEAAALDGLDDVARHFYHALNVGVLCDLTSSGLTKIATMRSLAEKVIELDPLFENAGGHRFLGILCYRTSSIPIVRAGSAEDGRVHLERATQLAPDCGENWLELAKFHVWSGAPKKALRFARLALEATRTEDSSAEDAVWIAEAEAIVEEHGHGR